MGNQICTYVTAQGLNWDAKRNMIMSKALKLIEKLNNIQPLYEMVNLGPKRTGLPVVIYASLEVPNHTPRIKVAERADHTSIHALSFVLSIEDEPKILDGEENRETIINNADFNRLIEWTIKNKDLLIRFWNGEFDDAGDFAELIVCV